MVLNSTILTRSHKVLTAKKKAKQAQVKEVIFDDEARRDFLTGFHKRKLQRTEASRKKAADKAKAARLEARRESRKALAEQAAKNVALVESAYGGQIEPEGDSSGEESGNHDEELHFEDEEQLATVTVVEDFTLDSLLDGPQSHQPSTMTDAAKPASPQAERNTASTSKAKTKPKKFRYETKAARAAKHKKEKARKAAKAGLATPHQKNKHAKTRR